MVVNREGYDFPSGRIEFDLNEIEAPLRRQPLPTRQYGVALIILLLTALVVTLLHFFVEPHIGVQEVHAAPVEEIRDNQYYCDHLGDYMMGDDVYEIVNYCENL